MRLFQQQEIRIRIRIIRSRRKILRYDGQYIFFIILPVNPYHPRPMSVSDEPDIVILSKKFG